MAPSFDSSSAAPDRIAAPRVYLDYAGFAPADPRVIAVMRPFLEGGVGNPSAAHTVGREARAALDGARAKVARLVGGTPDGIVFTSGATEANNLAVRGVAARAAGRHIVASTIEHVSVIHCCRELTKHGWDVSWVPVDGDGVVDPDAVARALRPDTALVSIMAANGEIGTIQPIAAIASRVRGHGALLHVDGVHALGRIAVDVEAWGIDLLTVSSNDLHGPPGAGALWIRPRVKLAPVLLGGGQEQGYRSGTPNLPALVGLGVAADLARAEGLTEAARLASLRDRLLDGVLARVQGSRRTGAPGPRRLPHHASVTIPDVRADAVLMELDLRGLAASSGSACASLTGEPSHVLDAMGLDRRAAEGSLCFTLGRWTTPGDVDAALELLPATVRRLRALAGR